MRLLSIETSCDETAVSIVNATGTLLSPRFTILGNALYSQAAIHAKFGGVYPNIAKREHAKNLPPLLKQALQEAGLFKSRKTPKALVPQMEATIQTILAREEGVFSELKKMAEESLSPKIDAIAVTFGPGLEPALWVGISFAKALGKLWDIPVVPVNHMEGHIVSVFFQKDQKNSVQKKPRKKLDLHYPLLALLISGGHTELVYAKTPLSYKTIGKTRDDAVGEAYDKAARMMGLPYPGGPEISKLAAKARARGYAENKWNLPRPMIHTNDYDFSFSGLKTAVLYRIRDHGTLSQKDKESLAKEFEDAVVEVIVHKSRKAIEALKPRSLVIGGGVIANPFIRSSFADLIKEFPDTTLFVPEMELSTDNSVMIAMAGYLRILKSPSLLRSKKDIIAKGNAPLS